MTRAIDLCLHFVLIVLFVVLPAFCNDAPDLGGVRRDLSWFVVEFSLHEWERAGRDPRGPGAIPSLPCRTAAYGTATSVTVNLPVIMPEIPRIS